MERLLGIGRAAGAREVHAGCSMNNLQRRLYSVAAIAARDNLRCGQPLINTICSAGQFATRAICNAFRRWDKLYLARLRGHRITHLRFPKEKTDALPPPPPPMAVWADEQRSATKAIGARIEADVCGMRQALFVYIILPASTYRYLSASAYCVCVHYIPYNFKFYMV